MLEQLDDTLNAIPFFAVDLRPEYTSELRALSEPFVTDLYPWAALGGAELVEMVHHLQKQSDADRYTPLNLNDTAPRLGWGELDGAARSWNCTFPGRCTIELHGTQLSPSDELILIETGKRCGHAMPSATLFSVAGNASVDRNGTVVQFVLSADSEDVGMSPVTEQEYQLCFCETQVCGAERCSLAVHGTGLTREGRVQLVDAQAQCGRHPLLEPTAPLDTMPRHEKDLHWFVCPSAPFLPRPQTPQSTCFQRGQAAVASWCLGKRWIWEVEPGDKRRSRCLSNGAFLSWRPNLYGIGNTHPPTPRKLAGSASSPGLPIDVLS